MVLQWRNDVIQQIVEWFIPLLLLGTSAAQEDLCRKCMKGVCSS